MSAKLERKKKKGVALIISVGILALVAMIATSFAINMQVEYRAAQNFFNYAAATEIADAGLDIAIADIRNWAKTVSYTTLINNISSAPYAGLGTEVTIPGSNNTYQVAVQREEADSAGTTQLINVNTLDETDFPWIDSLYDGGAGITYDQIARIIDYRDQDTNNTLFLLTSSSTNAGTQACNGGETNAKNAPYATIEEVRLALNDDAAYDKIKDMITVTSPIIRGGLIGKYYSSRIDPPANFNENAILNLQNFRGKVIELGRLDQSWGPLNTFPGADGAWTGWPESHDGEWAGGYAAEDFRFGAGLDQYGTVFSGYLWIPQNKVGQNIQFVVTSRNGAKVFIDGTQITSYWTTAETNTTMTGNATFTRAGWHPLRVEYYNNTNENVLYIEWDALGPKFYIPAEYYGWCPTSFYGKVYNYWTQRFYAQDGLAPTTTGIQYNQAGVFRITSTGRVKKADSTVLAVKQVSVIARVFGTWTQTTRAEFYAPWFSDYYFTGWNPPAGAGFSDGELRNVTWLDSCPTDADFYDDTTHKMHWEEDYATVPDSLKLGYWNNFDDDVAYNVITLKGDVLTQNYGPTGFDVNSVPTGYRIEDNMWTSCSFFEMLNQEGAYAADRLGPSYCLKMTAQRKHNVDPYDGNPLNTPTYPEEKTAALTASWYLAGTDTANNNLGSDMFVRSYVQDYGENPQNGWWNYPPTKRIDGGTACLPPWLTGWLVGKMPIYTSGGKTFQYYTLIKNVDGVIWGGNDAQEVSGCPGEYLTVDTDYPLDIGVNPTYAGKTNPYVLSEICDGNIWSTYHSFHITLDGAFNDGDFTVGPRITTAGNNAGVTKFSVRNIFNYTAASEEYPRILSHSGKWWGSSGQNVAEYDNVRIIYQNGYLASTPFVTKLSGDNQNIIWGTVSWNSDEPNFTSVAMSVRTADDLSVFDANWQARNNGDSISALSGRKLQYRAWLSSNSINNSLSTTADYTNSSVTPVLRDVTVTYLPSVETLYRR